MTQPAPDGPPVASRPRALPLRTLPHLALPAAATSPIPAALVDACRATFTWTRPPAPRFAWQPPERRPLRWSPPG